MTTPTAISKNFKVNKINHRKNYRAEPLQLKSLQIIPNHPESNIDQIDSPILQRINFTSQKENSLIQSKEISSQIQNSLNFESGLGNSKNLGQQSGKSTENQSYPLKNNKNRSLISKKTIDSNKRSLSKSRKVIEISSVSKNIFQTSFDDVLNNSPNISQNINFGKEKLSDFFRYTNNFKEARKKYVMKRFRLWGMTVVYITRLKKLTFQKALARKNEMQNIVIKINKPIQDLIQYYNVLLKNPLEFYSKLIKKYLQNQDFQYREYIFELIQQIAIRLQNSKITKTMIQIFRYTTLQRSFIPSKYLFEFQTQRLDFSQNFGCLINVSEEQSQMIIGIFLGIQILCGSILYKPWIGIDLKQPILQSQFPKYKNLVRDVGSIIYYIFKNQFENLPMVKNNKTILLSQVFCIDTQQKIPIIPTFMKSKEQNKQYQDTSKEFFLNQSDNFYELLKESNEERMFEIKQRLMNWIKRIYKKTKLSSLNDPKI